MGLKSIDTIKNFPIRTGFVIPTLAVAPYFEQNGIKLVNDDCFNLLYTLPDGSIDLILQDPPYGVTKNDWDKSPDLYRMWEQWLRVIKPNGAIIFTAQQPFTSELIMSNKKYYRYDLIWFKLGKSTGFLNANRMPLRSHEHILVFYKKLPTYNPQKVKGKPNHSKGNPSRNKKRTNNNYGKFDTTFQSPPTEDKFPISVLEFSCVHPSIHPTQKPVDLMRWLIRTYSNPGEVVFDGYSGSGTTAIACIYENRRFIGSEKKPDYYEMAVKQTKAELYHLKLC